jgi:hypothetical protein
MEHR